MAIAGSWLPTWVAMMKALIVAMMPTDRSMPPVSMVIVWQPARMASGMANLMVLAIQRSLTMPGRRISRTTTRPISRMISGIERPVGHEAANAAAERHAIGGAGVRRS